MSLLPTWAPNLHPLIIHFPIVLVLLAALVDLVQLLRPQSGMGRLAAGLYVLGAISAIVAFFTGRAASLAVFTPGMAHGLVAEHRRWALVTTAALVGLAVVRLAAQLAGRGQSRADRLVFATLALAAAILVQQTAERGARLVYQQGVGVAAGPDADASSVNEAGAQSPGASR